MRDAYRHAIERNGESRQAALGKVEQILSKVQSDPRALAYKGSLLTLIGAGITSPQKEIYQENGLKIMQEVLETLDPEKPWYLEILSVIVPRIFEMAQENPEITVPKELLLELAVDPRLNELTAFEAVNALVCAAEWSRKQDNSEDAEQFWKSATQFDAALSEEARERWQKTFSTGQNETE